MKNTILFDHYDSFVNAEKKELPYALNTNSELVSEFFRDFKYPISSWPIILPEKLTNELQQVSIEIPRLLNKIPSLYFENDAKRIADFYFDGNVQMAEFYMLCVQKQTPISCRLDLSYTTEGFKVLEVNAGSSIGGMEFQHFEPLIENVHSELSGTPQANFKAKQTQDIYMKFLLQQIGNVGNQVNVFLAGRADENEASKQAQKKFFNELLAKELNNKGKKGSVYIDTIASLTYKDNALYYKDTVIHSVLILDHSLSSMSPDLFRALLMDQVYFPDHLGTMFLGDKRNLGILRKLAQAKAFSEEENKLILNHIPWTEIITDTEVTYQGKREPLVPLLKYRKDDFVIKVANGMQGDDVFIGRYLSDEAWDKAITKALAHQKFVAQEFSDSINLLAPDNTNQWSPHKLIWGSFGFGKTYGGVWVRMSALKNTSGVINSATGAVEAIVYESHPKAKAHVLMI